MSLAWSSVKALSIPVGGVSRDVKRVSVGGVTVWEKAPALPYDAEVEYLRSNGGPYVSPGIVPSNATRWDMRFSLDTANAKMGVDVAAKRLRVIGRGGAFSADIYGSSSYNGSWSTGQTVNEISVNLPNKRVTVNGTTRTFSGSYASNDLPLLLLGSATGATSADARASTLYWCKIYTSGTLVRNFIPVRIGSVGYLYDRANPTGGPLGNGLYGNSGTGAFVIGPDANA